MTRDFKQSEANTAPNQYGLSWVLGGIAVGLLAGGVVYALMSKQQSGTVTPTTAANTTQSETATAASTAVATDTGTPTLQDKPRDDQRPGFSYHAVLPQLELDIPIPAPQEVAPTDLEPIEEPEPMAEAETEATETAAQEIQNTIAQGSYMFQLGAYQNQAQAVQMQRRASQNGMNTRIETANINGKVWYRVRLGPTDNLQVVNTWKQRLSGMGINPMMIRM
ncbi:MAG: SPOR domain-containing protein [Thiolinea sp.]